MRKLFLAVVVFLAFQQPAAAEKVVTVRELGEAVHYLIDLYRETEREVERLREENKELKKRIAELEKKFVLLKMEHDLAQKGMNQGSLPRKPRPVAEEPRRQENAMEVPVVEVVPGTTPNPYPWITFRRTDVTCALPERNGRGYIYYNVLVTRSREKAINVARNIARTGLCTVVRRAARNGSLYRVVVIPDREGTWQEKLKKLGLNWFPYVRDLDLTRSSGGKL